jgi:hypothetical protein
MQASRPPTARELEVGHVSCRIYNYIQYSTRLADQQTWQSLSPRLRSRSAAHARPNRIACEGSRDNEDLGACCWLIRARVARTRSRSIQNRLYNPYDYFHLSHIYTDSTGRNLMNGKYNRLHSNGHDRSIMSTYCTRGCNSSTCLTCTAVPHHP